MAITFHCEHCNKKIEAPETTGGKWGKCPACHNKVYVPNMDMDEEIKLAPIDETEAEKQKRLMAEPHKLTLDILQERDVPENVPEQGISTPLLSNKDLATRIIICLRQMADGQLAEADGIAESITPCGREAIKILDRIGLSDMPEPELTDIPPQILSGLIRTLRAKIT